MIWVSGDVQKYEYRSRVVTMARALGIKGTIQTLPDGRVKVMAEGEEADLERFAEALKMENSFFWVSCVEIKRFDPHGDLDDFHLALTERDDEFWLDEWIKYLEELLEVTKEGFERVVRGTDRNPSLKGGEHSPMMDKNNRMQDQMLDKQDETKGEVRGLRSDLKESLDVRLSRMEADLSDVKSALREKGIL